MDISALKDSVLGRQKILAKIYAKNRDLNLKDYARQWRVNLSGPVSDYGEFLSAVEKLAASLYGGQTAGKIAAEISKRPLVSTIDHHGIFNHPFFLSSNLIHSLYPDLQYLVCFPTAGVSLNNSSWPGSLLLTGRDGQMRRLSLFPDKIKTQAVLATESFGLAGVDKLLSRIRQADFLSEDKKKRLYALAEEIFLDQKLIGLGDFSGQAAALSRLLWSKIFPTAPQLLYLPIEQLVTAVLTQAAAKNPGHLLHRLFFTQNGWAIIEKYFQDSPGAFTQPHFSEAANPPMTYHKTAFNRSPINSDKKSGAGFTDIYKGSFLFWGMGNSLRRVHLIRQKGLLVGRDFSLSADSLAEALASGKIYPSSLVCLITLLYYGISCLGGFNQVNWLANIKEKFINLLKDWGETQIAGRIETIPTDNFAEGNLAFGVNEQGRIYKPTALDLFLDNDEFTYEKYHLLAAEVTLGESIDTQLPEIYKVITHASERRKDLLAISEADIISQNGLENKIRRVFL